MSDTLTDAHHDWVSNTLGVDPRKYAAAADPGAASSGKGIFDTIADTVSDAATTVADTVSDAARDVADGAKQVVQGVEDGARQVAQGVQDVADTAVEVGKQVVQGVEDGARQVAQGVQDVADTAVDISKQVVQGVEDGARQIAQGVEDAADTAVDIGKQVVQDVEDGARQVVQGVEDAADTAVDVGKQVAQGVEDALKGVVDGAASGVKKIVQDAKDVVDSAIDDVAAGAKTVEEGIERAVDLIKKKLAESGQPAAPTSPSSTPSTPTTPPSAPPITLTSQTEASSPTNRTRTKLGVGERVTLKVSPGPGSWTAPGAKLSAKTGSTVTMTAPTRPGTVDVTVDVGGQTKTLKFTVVAPSRVVQELLTTEHANNGLPNAGFHAQIYLGPDDVNFNAVTFTEDEVGAKATGSWVAKNGEGHSPNPSPLGCTSTVVAGKGTRTSAQDHCWSGYVPGLSLTDWTGEMSWTITWHWQCGSGNGVIGRVVQRVATTSNGTTTISKAGASFTAALS